jgi:hypothetical protein
VPDLWMAWGGGRSHRPRLRQESPRSAVEARGAVAELPQDRLISDLVIRDSAALMGAAFQAACWASWRASPALKMFLAAFTSAWAWWPQARQRNSAWLARLSAAVCPHWAHRREV